MNDKKSWYEQDNFWETTETIMFDQQRLSKASLEVTNIIKLLEIQKGADILDLCCGIGRHALEFSRRGFNVTGVDRTQKYIDRAVKQVNNEGLNVELICSDMRDFRRSDTYDVIVNFFTSFGYFENSNDDRLVVENMYESLKTGGRILLEMMGKEILAREFRERDWYEREGNIVLEERKLKQNWAWLENRWILIKNSQRIEHSVSLRIYSAVELSALLGECGFSNIKVYGDLEGNNYDQMAKRLVIVGYK